MRIVATQIGAGGFVAEPDLRLRLPGRGAWLHPTPDCLDLALRRRALPRALRLQAPLDTTALAGAVAASLAGRSTTAAVHPDGGDTSRNSEPEAGYHADEHPMSAQQ
jgi:hypothetical protein